MAERNNDESDELTTSALRELRALQRRVSKDSHAFWFPCVAFGVLVLASAPLYWMPSLPGDCSHGCLVSYRPGRLGLVVFLLGNPMGGGPALWTGRATALYWLLALPVGYLATRLYFSSRGGVPRVRARSWIIVTSFFVVMVGYIWVLGYISMLGMQALVFIALGLLLLAVAERSPGHFAYAIGFSALAALSSFNYQENLFTKLGIGRPFSGGGLLLPNLLLSAGYLVIGGIGFRIAGRLRTSGVLFRTSAGGPASAAGPSGAPA
jgi:hypothetical protein